MLDDHCWPFAFGGFWRGCDGCKLAKIAPHQTAGFFLPSCLGGSSSGTEMPKYLRITADQRFCGLFLHGCVILQIAHAKKRHEFGDCCWSLSCFFSVLAWWLWSFKYLATEMPKYLRITADQWFGVLARSVILQIAHAKKRHEFGDCCWSQSCFFRFLPGGCDPSNIWHWNAKIFEDHCRPVVWCSCTVCNPSMQTFFDPLTCLQTKTRRKTANPFF